MTTNRSHPAYEIIYADQSLTETALFAESFHANVPYHNFGHVLNAIAYAEKEITTYNEHETTVLPVTGIYKALLLHDVLVHRPLDGSFATKEHRSASLAGYALRELGDSSDDVDAIQRWIINTNPQYPCSDDAGRIVCRADLGNTADDFSIFVREFIKVYRENQQMKLKYGRPQDIVNPTAAARESIEYLQMYFRQDLTLGDGSWDTTSNGMCAFVSRALSNFKILQGVVKDMPESDFTFDSDD